LSAFNGAHATRPVGVGEGAETVADPLADVSRANAPNQPVAGVEVDNSTWLTSSPLPSTDTFQIEASRPNRLRVRSNWLLVKPAVQTAACCAGCAVRA
jgi:hypothetical protein